MYFTHYFFLLLFTKPMPQFIIPFLLSTIPFPYPWYNSLQFMGNSNPNSLPTLTTIPHPQHWVSLGFSSDYEILLDTSTGEQVEQSYIHTRYNRTHEEEMEEYLFRSQQKGNIVRVLYADKVESKNFCVGSDKYKVRTERIVKRLEEMGGLAVGEGMFLLGEAMTGFQEIYQYGKKATVTDQMIGVNKHGEVKVWVNPQFGDNRPQEYGIEIRGRPLSLTEPEVVQQIFMTVKDHMQNKQFPVKLVERMHEQMTFSEAIRAINTYAWEENITIPKRFFLKNENSQSVIKYHEKPISTHDSQQTKQPNSSRSDMIEIAVPVQLQNSRRVKQVQPISQNIFQSNLHHNKHTAQPRSQSIETPSFRRLSPAPIQPKLQQSKRTAVTNAVINLQSRAIMLKQQTNQLDSSKRTVVFPGADSIRINTNKHTASKQKLNLPTPQPKQAIMVQNRQNRSLSDSNYNAFQRSRSEGHFMIEKVQQNRANQHLPSGFHLLQHKNPQPLENSIDKRRSPSPAIQYYAKELLCEQTLSNSLEKKQYLIQPKPPLNIKAKTDQIKPKQPPKVSFNLQNSKTQIREQIRSSSDARIFKPQFSFDPKYFIKPPLSQSTKQPVHEHKKLHETSAKRTIPELSETVTNSNSGIVVQTSKNNEFSSNKLNDSGFLVRNFTPESNQQPTKPPSNGLLQNVRMAKTIEFKNCDQENYIIDSKIKEIQQQLKSITYLDSIGNTPERQSKGSAFNSHITENDSSKPCMNTTNQTDTARISNSSLSRLQKNGFLASK